MSGDRMGITYGVQADYKKLFYSEELAALRVPITLMPGYGKLEMGTGLSRATSASGAARLGMYLPYDPTATITGAEVAPGRAYLVADHTSGDFDCQVTLDNSYKFVVNDDFILVGSGEAAENLGKITAIDRTTYTNKAVIAFTSATGKNYTTANFAYATIEGYDTMTGILQETTNTGEGVNAFGGFANLIIGNCVLYTGMLVGNVDSAGLSDVSASTLGQYTYIR